MLLDARMTRSHKIEGWIAVMVGILLSVSHPGPDPLAETKADFSVGEPCSSRIRTHETSGRSREWQFRLAISLPPTSRLIPRDSFVLRLRKPIRKGHPLFWSFATRSTARLYLDDVCRQQALHRPSRSALQ